MVIFFAKKMPIYCVVDFLSRTLVIVRKNGIAHFGLSKCLGQIYLRPFLMRLQSADGLTATDVILLRFVVVELLVSACMWHMQIKVHSTHHLSISRMDIHFVILLLHSCNSTASNINRPYSFHIMDAFFIIFIIICVL